MIVFFRKAQCIKIIHGHGTGAKKGVREWCGFQEGRFQAVNGELFCFNPTIASMRADCGSPSDQDLERKNGAITYIWLW